MTEEELKEQVKNIKFYFFTYRNGPVADSLRAAGNPHKEILGLMVPQLASIARQFPQSMQLAERLWSETEYREARLLACYLFPPEEVTREQALRLWNETIDAEEADMLAFRLIRRLPFAAEILEATGEGTPLERYRRKTLTRNLE